MKYCCGFELTRKRSINRNPIENLKNSLLKKGNNQDDTDDDNISSKININLIKLESNQIIDLDFNIANMKLFFNQDIFKIRNKKELFIDDKFSNVIASIIENTESSLGLSLSSRFNTKNINELDKLIKWKRTKVRKFKK
jgi:hypothetical protein